MHGNRDKHEAMWQHLIDSVDDIFKLYADTKAIEDDPEWIIMDMKHAFIMQNYKGDGHIPFYCYACLECICNCSDCPIIHKAGYCANDDSSAFKMILDAIEEQDRDKFIKEAGRLKDAWE